MVKLPKSQREYKRFIMCSKRDNFRAYCEELEGEPETSMLCRVLKRGVVVFQGHPGAETEVSYISTAVKGTKMNTT